MSRDLPPWLAQQPTETPREHRGHLGFMLLAIIIGGLVIGTIAGGVGVGWL
jgi:hypothetical protein